MGNTDCSHNMSQNADMNGNNGNSNNSDYNFRPENEPLDANLINNINMFKKIFCYPLNQDFVIREVHIKSIKWDLAARKKFFTYDEYAKYDWMKHYPEAKVNIKYEVKFRNFGKQLAPPELPTDNDDLMEKSLDEQ